MTDGPSQTRSRWTLRRRLLLLYVAVVVLVLLGAAGAIVSLTIGGRASAIVQSRLSPAQVAAARLSQSYRDIDTDLRAYLASGQPAALVPINTGRVQAAQLDSVLQVLLRREQSSLAALDQLRAAAEAWLADSVAPALAQAQAARAAATPRLGANDDARFSALRQQLQSFTTVIADRVAVEERLARDSNVLVAVSLLIGSALALGVGVAAYVTLRSSLTRPLDRLVRHLAIVDAGDLDEPIPAAGPPELAALGQAAERMRQRLRDDAAGRVNSALIAGHESERRRIAGQIHDDQVQALTAASLRLQQLRRHIDDPDLLRLATAAEDATANATARLRRMIFELYSPVLDHEGLIAALDVYLDETFGDQVTWTITGDPGPLPPAIAALSYRLTREALINVVKHANANRIDITIERDANGLSTSVHDDGVGFDPASLPAAEVGHLGMEHSRQLARAAGGTWDVTSAPDRGTTIRFRLPVTPNA